MMNFFQRSLMAGILALCLVWIVAPQHARAQRPPNTTVTCPDGSVVPFGTDDMPFLLCGADLGGPIPEPVPRASWTTDMLNAAEEWANKNCTAYRSRRLFRSIK